MTCLQVDERSTVNPISTDLARCLYFYQSIGFQLFLLFAFCKRAKTHQFENWPRITAPMLFISSMLNNV